MLFSDAYDQPVTTLCPSGTTIEDMTAIISSDMVRNCYGPVTVGDRISPHSCQRSRVSMPRLAIRSCCKVLRTCQSCNTSSYRNMHLPELDIDRNGNIEEHSSPGSFAKRSHPIPEYELAAIMRCDHPCDGFASLRNADHPNHSPVEGSHLLWRRPCDTISLFRQQRLDWPRDGVLVWTP